MKKQLVVLSLLCVIVQVETLAAASSPEENSSPFVSNEDVNFIGRDAPLWGLMRNAYFIGTYVRNQASRRDFAAINVYGLPPTDKIKIDRDLCLVGADVAIGVIKPPFHLQSVKERQSRKGKICEVRVTDSDPQALHPDHRALVAFIGGEAFAFQIDLGRASAGADTEEIANFVQGLSLSNSRRMPQGKAKSKSK